MAQILVELPEEETDEEIEVNTIAVINPVPELLRSVRQIRWDIHTDQPVAETPWLLQGEVQADVFQDLRTTKNELSVWQVDDEPGIHRVVAALAAQRDRCAVFDYALVDVDTVEGLGIVISQQDGETEDDEANKQWHYDLKQLTSDKVNALAKALAQKKVIRIGKNKVKELITEGIKQSRLNWDSLSEAMKREIPKSE